MLLSLALTLALASAAQQAAALQPNEVAPAIVPIPAYKAVPTDFQIVQQLNQLVREQPDRVVCIQRRRTGTLFPTTECRSMQAWYDFEDGRDTPARIAKYAGEIDPGGGMLGPPFELVDLVKAGYRQPGIRLRAEADARARAAAHRRAVQPSTPPVSNP